MWQTIRKWWFLQRLEEVIEDHTLRESFEKVASGGRTLSTRDFFIRGKLPEHQGIIHKSISRLRWWMPWENKRKEKLLKKRAYEYGNFYDSLLYHEKYIKLAEISGQSFPILTWEGHDVHGYGGLFELLLRKYPLTWSATWKIIVFFITTLTTTAVGSYFIIKFGNYVIKIILHV